MEDRRKGQRHNMFVCHRSRAAGESTEDVADSAHNMWETFVAALPRIGVALVLIGVGWAISRAVRAGLRRIWYRTQTLSFATVMSKVVGWMVLIVAGLLAIAVTFPSVRPVDLLAGLGFFSVAVGFAFQDILENTLSGVLLLFRQPFRSGDQIEVQGNTGTVEAITIRETRLKTFDGQLMIIPNRDVYKNAIRVQTAYSVRRFEFAVGVAFDSDLEFVCKEIVATLDGLPDVSSQPSPSAMVASLGSSVVEIRVWLWGEPFQDRAAIVLHDAISAVKQRLERCGIEMPAEIVALQGTSSLAAALHGLEVTPGGAVVKWAGPNNHTESEARSAHPTSRTTDCDPA